MKQDFLTAFSGTDGRLESVLTDEGERLQIVEGASGLRVSADTAVRIVANYETLAIGDGDVAGAKLYALLQTVSPVPLAGRGVCRRDGENRNLRRYGVSGGGMII